MATLQTRMEYGVAKGLLYILVLNGCMLSVAATCDRFTGPEKTHSECLRFKNSNFVAQWATCRPNTYINKASEGRYHCVGEATYCWYSCMCELHQQCQGGIVYADCSCDPNEPATDKVLPGSNSLPLSCFEPTGNECSWYKYCLRNKYSCEGVDEAVNAITFNDQFCQLYSDHYHSFPFGARLWMDQTKKCHIAALVPLLSKPDGLTTCNNVATSASDSNIRCMTMGLYACALDWTEKLLIFWTLAGSETFPEQMRRLWEVFATSDHFNPVEKRLSLEYSNISSIELLVQLKTTSRNHVTAAKIVDDLAAKRDWASKGLTWFGYNTGSVVRTKYSQINARILFAPIQYDLNALDFPDVNMTEIHEVSSLANAIRNRLQLTIDGNVVDVISMTACSDVDCKLSYLFAKARPKITTISRKPVNVGYVFSTSVWYIVASITLISLI